MNIAIGVLLLLLLLFPGISLRLGYLNGPYSHKTIGFSFLDELLISIFPSFIFQIGGYLIIENCIGYDVELKIIYQLLIGSSDNSISQSSFQIIENSLGMFLGYNFVLILMPYLLGFLLRSISIKFGLDNQFDILKIYNDWYNLLSAEKNKCDFIYIDILTEMNDKAYIYCGILTTFYPSSSNGLDRIHLTNVYRRPLDSDQSSNNKKDNHFSKRYYQIPGNVFIINYANIINMNIHYLNYTE